MNGVREKAEVWFSHNNVKLNRDKIQEITFSSENNFTDDKSVYYLV